MDKTELQALVDSIASLNQLDYTPESWDALQTELTAAQAVLDDPEADQVEIDAAEGGLQAAIDGLVELADKTALQAAIDTANGRNETDYTPSSWAPFEDARVAATTVGVDQNATQAEVDAALADLNTASSNLVLRADKNGLRILIADFEALTETDYTPSTWASAVSVYDDAVTLEDNPDATQTQVDDAESALNAAINALVARADFTTLNAKLTTANGFNEEDYSPETWAVLTPAVSAGETVAADMEATQSDVDEAAEDLNAALAQMMSSTGCQVPFNADDDEFLDLFGYEPFAPQDSTQRRIELTADGTEYSVGIHTAAGSTVELNSPWQLGARVQAFGGDLSATDGTVVQLIAVNSVDENDFYALTLSFDGTDWTAQTEEGDTVTGPVGINQDLDYGPSFSLANDGDVIVAYAGGEQVGTMDPGAEAKTVRFMIAMSLPATATGGSTFFVDALTNEHSPDICSALYEAVTDPERDAADLATIQTILADYGEKMAPGKVVTTRHVLRAHLSLMHAFYVALALDTRRQTTEGMDTVYDAFRTDPEDPDPQTTAFDSKYTRRNADVLCTLYPREAKIYLEFLRVTYETVNGTAPGWLECNASSICSCLPKDVATRYLDYLNHV